MSCGEMGDAQGASIQVTQVPSVEPDGSLEDESNNQKDEMEGNINANQTPFNEASVESCKATSAMTGIAKNSKYRTTRRFYKLSTNSIFIGRIFTLFLTILLFALSITYCIGKLCLL